MPLSSRGGYRPRAQEGSEMSTNVLSSFLMRAALVALWALSLTTVMPAQSPVDLINVGENPSSIAINETTGRVYVVNFTSESVTVLNGSTLDTTVSPVGPRAWR